MGRDLHEGGDSIRAKIADHPRRQRRPRREDRVPPDLDGLAALVAGTSFRVVRIAAQASFTCTAADWYKSRRSCSRPTSATTSRSSARASRSSRRRSTCSPSLRGPLAVEGGVTGADRSLELGLKLPGEQDGPLFAIATQAPETKQIDILNIYNDSSQAHNRGAMNSTTLKGFGMAKDLDFGAAYGGAQGETFGEPQIFPGGISYGTVQFVDGEYETDGGKSTIEVFNLLLGSATTASTSRARCSRTTPVKLTGTIVLTAQGAGSPASRRHHSASAVRRRSTGGRRAS